MITNDKKNEPKTSQFFYCKKCDYKTSKASNWNRHITTRKHKMVTNDKKNEPKRASLFTCEYCSKVYKFASGLSRHKSRCNKKQKIQSLEVENKKVDNSLLSALNNLVNGKIKNNGTTINNNDLMNVLNEISSLKEIINKTNETTIVNNTTNTQNISINMFLNNHCKDAMCMEDFLGTVKLSVNDLFETRKLGYVGGISNIFIKNLSGIPSIKRPIHCSDTKRMLFYVKDEDGWNKDGVSKVEKAIEEITLKQIKTLQAWEEKNPNYLENPELLTTWNNLVHSIMGGTSKEERYRNKKLIKKQVGETTFIKDAIANLK